ncbi:MAG: hypothetical protein LBR36_06390 [Bacteroidales bacterium]|jgi:hypothetical protein|nr:hypothetical protein [Bacteroidales bacterium]
MTILFIITASVFIQCVSTKNKDGYFLREYLSQNIIDSSYVMKYFDKMGKDSLEYFNEYETDYFNERFRHHNKNIDFAGKK